MVDAASLALPRFDDMAPPPPGDEFKEGEADGPKLGDDIITVDSRSFLFKAT